LPISPVFFVPNSTFESLTLSANVAVFIGELLSEDIVRVEPELARNPASAIIEAYS
jgi:hypothetical protein